MLNPLSFISKFIKSSNQYELDKISKILREVNSWEEKIVNLDDSEFPKKTNDSSSWLQFGIMFKSIGKFFK